MKNYSILLVALLCIIFSCANQTSKEALSKNLYLGDCNNDSICTTIANVDSSLQAFFSCANFNQINRLIDPEMKLTVLYANGCYPQYEKLDSLSSDPKSYNLPDWVIDDLFNALDFSNIHIDSLQHINTPVFDGEKILQQGAFIDESNGKKIMSSVIGNLIQVEKMEMKDTDYVKVLEKDSIFYSNLENKTLRVVLANADSDDENWLKIFHYTIKNNRLYLTLVDLYSYDTSA